MVSIAKIQQLIAEGDIRPALLHIKDILVLSDNSVYNEALVLLSSYSYLESHIISGTLDDKEERINKNKIVQRALLLLDKIQADEEIFQKYQATVEKLELAHKRKNIILDQYLTDTLVHRISNVKVNHRGVDFRILRIGKTLEQFDRFEAEVLRHLGLQIDYAYTSQEARDKISAHQYAAIISSARREGNPTEGFDFHLSLVHEGIDLPFIFYIGYTKREKGVPPYAFGITHRPNELIHLVLDLIERG